jgi:plastocyanin
MASYCRAVVALGLMFALSVACAPEQAATDSPESAAPEMATEAATEAASEAMPQTFTVYVDGQLEDFTSAFLAYFPSEVSVHPGDTVDFELVDTGEPHTVTFGALADAAAAKWDTLGFAAAEEPEFAALPPMLSETHEVNQGAAQPCFVQEGTPGTDVCAEKELPAFDGTAAFYSSGWMAPQSTFSVTFAEDAAPGTYRYLCLLHTPMMVGSVTVVAADEEVPAPDEVMAAGETELESRGAPLRAVVEAAEPPPGGAFAGLLTEEEPTALADIFLPEELTVAAGDTVTWLAMGPHTISFNAPQGANQLRLEAADGTISLNPDAVAPSNSPGMPEPSGEPAEDQAEPDPDAPPPPPVEIVAGPWDGTGFLSSGILESFPPTLFNYSVTFTQPGTYAYQCLVHPKMEGRIVVQ